MDCTGTVLAQTPEPAEQMRMPLRDSMEPTPERIGWINGSIGVLIFSISLPATRIAVLQLDPLFVTFARAAIAGLLSAALLVIYRLRPPARTEFGALTLVTVGVVLGFPLLTALALRQLPAAHSMIFVGLLPLVTAFFAVLRAGERLTIGRWLCSLAGTGLVATGAFWVGGSATHPTWTGDCLMAGAILVCGLGYAEGGRLTRLLGGWQVISWSLVLALPLTLPLAFCYAPAHWTMVTWPAWAGLAYVSVFSMFIGFIFWYRGLAQAGIAKVGQLQLLQPFLGFGWAACLLGEFIDARLLVTAAGVLCCVALGRHLDFRPGAPSRARRPSRKQTAARGEDLASVSR